MISNYYKWRCLSVLIFTIFYGCEDKIPKWDLLINVSPIAVGNIIVQNIESPNDSLISYMNIKDGTRLNLAAIPTQPGWNFYYWGGDLKGSENPTNIIMDGNKSVSAVFDSIQYFDNSMYKVGVYYYPWYSYDFHGKHYLREHLFPPQLPELGEYIDRTENVINQHLDWSRYAGISFWVASWWGPNSREDITLLDYILPNLRPNELKIAVFYETTGRTNNFHDYSSIESDINYISERYFNHPNYLRINNKPVLFIYLTRVLSGLGTLNSTLITMRNAALAAGYQIFIVGDQVFGSAPQSDSDIRLLDAITNYDVYGSMGASRYASQNAVDLYYSAQDDWKNLAQSVDVGFIPAVSPGFNDTGVRSGHIPLSRKLEADQEFGSLFRSMVVGAKNRVDSSLGNIFMVTSWNEWHEDTQIEPVQFNTATSLDDSPTGFDYTYGLSYEGYGMRYIEILHDEITQ